LDAIPFEVASGDASVKFVEALLAEKPYHGISGPWNNLDCLDTVQLGPAARVLHTMKGENAEFTHNPEKYPYVFRFLRSMDGIMHLWAYLLWSNAWPTSVSVLSESSTIDGLSNWFTRYNLTNRAILADIGENAVREAWYRPVVDIIRTTRLRVVITYFNVDMELGMLACHIFQSGIRGLQFFAPGYYTPGWSFDIADALECTADDLFQTLYGYIATMHTFVAPGVSVQGLSFPILDGVDQSKLYLTCMPDMTVQEYFESPEIFIRGLYHHRWFVSASFGHERVGAGYDLCTDCHSP